MNIQILPLHRLQAFENECKQNHVLIQYRTPGITYNSSFVFSNGESYKEVSLSPLCLAKHIVECHDIESPPTNFNNMVMKNYPHFYDKSVHVVFQDSHAIELLKFVEEWVLKIDLIICQCDGGISRSAGTAAALSKIFNGDDMWVFESDVYVPNRTIYRTIIKNFNEIII